MPTNAKQQNKLILDPFRHSRGEDSKGDLDCTELRARPCHGMSWHGLALPGLVMRAMA